VFVVVVSPKMRRKAMTNIFSLAFDAFLADDDETYSKLLDTAEQLEKQANMAFWTVFTGLQEAHAKYGYGPAFYVHVEFYKDRYSQLEV
jgi:hypothetical protein